MNIHLKHYKQETAPQAEKILRKNRKMSKNPSEKIEKHSTGGANKLDNYGNTGLLDLLSVYNSDFAEVDCIVFMGIVLAEKFLQKNMKS